MKKKYNKAICLDACIFNNIIGLDNGDSTFSNSYNKEMLTRYVTHHGYMMSDYNLYEMLKRDNWNDSEVLNNIKKINSRTRQKIIAINPNYKNLLEHIPNEKERNEFLHIVSKNIVDFASDYLSKILIIAYLVPIYTIILAFKKYNLDYDSTQINDLNDKIAGELRYRIKMEFRKYDLFNKSIAEKIINKFYLIINHLSIDWYNSDMKNLSDKIIRGEYDNLESDLLSIVNNFFNNLKKYDFSIERSRFDNTKYAKNDDNIIYLLCSTTFKSNTENIDKDTWNNYFSKMINDIVLSIYGKSKKDDVVGLYFEHNFYDIYLRHIKDYKTKKETNEKIIKLFNVNDIVDLCSLTYAQEKGLIFISNDKGINRVIDKIYTNEQKDFVNTFINYKFTKC